MADYILTNFPEMHISTREDERSLFDSVDRFIRSCIAENNFSEFENALKDLVYHHSSLSYFQAFEYVFPILYTCESKTSIKKMDMIGQKSFMQYPGIPPIASAKNLGYVAAALLEGKDEKAFRLCEILFRLDPYDRFFADVFSSALYSVIVSGRYELISQYCEMLLSRDIEKKGICADPFLIRSALIHEEYELLHSLEAHGWKITADDLAEIACDDESIRCYTKYACGNECEAENVSLSDFIERFVPKKMRFVFYCYLRFYMSPEKFEAILDELPKIEEINFFETEMNTHGCGLMAKMPYAANVYVRVKGYSDMRMKLQTYDKKDVHLILDCSDFEIYDYKPILNVTKINDMLKNDFIIPDGEAALSCISFILDKNSHRLNDLLIKKGMIHKGNAEVIIKYAVEKKLLSLVQAINNSNIYE